MSLTSELNLQKNGEKVDLYDAKVGIETLGNLLQCNPDSPDNNFYGPWLGKNY